MRILSIFFQVVFPFEILRPFIYAYSDSHANDAHLVFAGACNNEDANFCSDIVRNSICNTAKNECFCRKGYVAVKEGNSVSCKTLLTDLKCRVDADCVHINHSSCHPGAGFCTCPGNTVFVSQLSACRTRAFEQTSLVCVSCKQEGGTCFLLTEEDLANLPNRLRNTTERFGCACSNLRTNTRFRDPARPQRTCGGRLVDIGEVCNEEDLICLSTVAKCSPSGVSHLSITGGRVDEKNLTSTENAVGTAGLPSSSHLLGTCQCPPNYLPVYQKLLQYYECFPKAERSEPECQNCLKNGGECFHFSSKQVSCKCPPGFSDLPSDKKDVAAQCVFKHVQEVCKNGFLVICYQPHWEPPYEALVDRLETGEADVRLAYSGFADSSLPQCSLSALNYFDDRVLNFANEAAELWRTAFLRMSAQAVPPNLNNRRPYCLQLDLVKMTYACGIRIYQLGGGQREYQGLLEVLLDHSLYNPSKDLQIPFKCIDHHISRHREERLMQNIHTNITMQVWTEEENAKPTRSVIEGERITLRFALYSLNAQESISVEKCYLTNSVVQLPSGSTPDTIQIYSAGCSVSDLAYEIKFKSNKISGNELQTEPFPVFPLEQAYSLFIHCSIRLCRQAVLCDPTAAECLSGNQEGLMKPRSPRGPSIERWVHLNIIQSDKASLKHSKARYGNSFSKGVSGGTTENLSFESEYPCDFAVCLTQAQLVVISTVTVIVIITVGLISLIALRQKHLFPHVNAGSTRTEPLTETLQYGDPLGAIGEEGGFHNLKPYEYINCSTRISDCNPPSTYSNLVVSHEPWMQAPVFHQAPLNETLSRSSLVHNQRTDLLVIPASTVSQSKAGGYMKDFIELNPNLYTSAIVPRTVISSATNASIVPQTLLSPGENSYEHNTHGIMISNPCLSTPATRENRGQRQIQRPTKQSLPFRPRHEIKSQTTEVDAPGQAPSNDLSNGNKRLLTTLENPLHRDNEILLEAGTDKADLSSTYLRLHPIGGGISKKSRRRQQVLLQVGLDPVVGFMSPMEDSLNKRQQALASTPGTGKPTEVGTSGGQIQVVRYDLSGKEVKNELGQPLPFNQIQNSEALQTHMTAGYQGTTSHIRPAAPQGLFYDCNGMWCSDQDGTVYMKTTTAADTDLAVNLQNSSLYPLMKEVRCSSQQKNTQNNNPNNTFFCKSTANSVFSTDRIEDSSLT